MASNTQRSSFSALLQQHWNNPVVDELLGLGYTIYTDSTTQRLKLVTNSGFGVDPADEFGTIVNQKITDKNASNPTGYTNIPIYNIMKMSCSEATDAPTAHQLLLSWSELYCTRQVDNSPTIQNLMGLVGGVSLQLETLALPNNTIPAGTHYPDAITRLPWATTWAKDMIGTMDGTLMQIDTHSYIDALDAFRRVKTSSSWSDYTIAVTSVKQVLSELQIPDPITTLPTPETDAAYYARVKAAIDTAVATQKIILDPVIATVKNQNASDWVALTDHSSTVTQQVEREQWWWKWNNVEFTHSSLPFPDYSTISVIMKAATLSQTLDSVKHNPDVATQVVFNRIHSANPTVLAGLAETVVR